MAQADEKIQAELDRLNRILAAEIEKKLEERQFNKLRDFLKGSHGISSVKEVKKAETVDRLIELLINDKKIQVGKPNGYKLLIDGLTLINELVLAELVEEYQLKLAAIAGVTNVANERAKIVQSQTNDAT